MDSSLIVGLLVAAGLGLIPAEIAKSKGYDHYWRWWFYGWMLFIIALIHTICMPDKLNPAGEFQVITTDAVQAVSKLGSADEIKKYKELLDNNIITQEEFDAKKKQLLGV